MTFFPNNLNLIYILLTPDLPHPAYPGGGRGPRPPGTRHPQQQKILGLSYLIFSRIKTRFNL